MGEYDKIFVGKGDITSNSNIKNPDLNDLFYLSELAFVVELAMARAQQEDSVYRLKIPLLCCAIGKLK